MMVCVVYFDFSSLLVSEASFIVESTSKAAEEVHPVGMEKQEWH